MPYAFTLSVALVFVGANGFSYQTLGWAHRDLSNVTKEATEGWETYDFCDKPGNENFLREMCLKKKTTKAQDGTGGREINAVQKTIGMKFGGSAHCLGTPQGAHKGKSKMGNDCVSLSTITYGPQPGATLSCQTPAQKAEFDTIKTGTYKAASGATLNMKAADKIMNFNPANAEQGKSEMTLRAVYAGAFPAGSGTISFKEVQAYWFHSRNFCNTGNAQCGLGASKAGTVFGEFGLFLTKDAWKAPLQNLVTGSTLSFKEDQFTPNGWLPFKAGASDKIEIHWPNTFGVLANFEFYNGAYISSAATYLGASGNHEFHYIHKFVLNPDMQNGAFIEKHGFPHTFSPVDASNTGDEITRVMLATPPGTTTAHFTATTGSAGYEKGNYKITELTVPVGWGIVCGPNKFHADSASVGGVSASVDAGFDKADSLKIHECLGGGSDEVTDVHEQAELWRPSGKASGGVLNANKDLCLNLFKASGAATPTKTHTFTNAFAHIVFSPFQKIGTWPTPDAIYCEESAAWTTFARDYPKIWNFLSKMGLA